MAVEARTGIAEVLTLSQSIRVSQASTVSRLKTHAKREKPCIEAAQLNRESGSRRGQNAVFGHCKSPQTMQNRASDHKNPLKNALVFKLFSFFTPLKKVLDALSQNSWWLAIFSFNSLIFNNNIALQVPLQAIATHCNPIARGGVCSRLAMHITSINPMTYENIATLQLKIMPMRFFKKGIF